VRTSTAGKRVGQHLLRRFAAVVVVHVATSSMAADFGATRSPSSVVPAAATPRDTGDLTVVGRRLADFAASARATAVPAGRRLAAGPSTWRVHRRLDGTAGFITTTVSPAAVGAGAGKSAAAPSRVALDLLQRHADLFGIERPRDELRHLETVTAPDGRRSVRFARRDDGVPLWGEDLTLHLDAAGHLVSFNGVYSPTPPAPTPARRIDAGEALARAQAHVAGRSVEAPIPGHLRALLDWHGPTTEALLRADGGALRPVWRVELRPNLRDRWIVAVDGVSGDVIEAWNGTPHDGPSTATAIDLAGRSRRLNTYAVADSFLLIDASKPTFAPVQPDVVGDPRGALVTLTAGGRDLTRTTRIEHVSSPDNGWVDATAVSAHANMGVVFDYFLNTHGRRSIDGVGGSLYSVIHVTDGGEPMDNAFWSGAFMAYGDGGDAFAPLAGGLDVAAHEMTHGVIQQTVNLEYRNQSGALNESFADIFAAMVDREDWHIGEDVVRGTGLFPSGALRDMESPNNGSAPGRAGWQPAHMDEFRDLPLSTDNGGVHINSGIPNRAAFLVAESLGRAQAEQLYYRVLANRLINQRGNFVDMRNAAVQAATELFGPDEVEAVEAAYDAVGIVGDEGYQPPQRREPVPGEELILVVSARTGDRGLYLVRPSLQSEEDISLLTSTPVYDRTGNSVTVAADGSFVLFVDGANNLRGIGIDGSDEVILSDSRDWASVALSPDGRRLAATTILEDGTITLLDFADPEQSKRIELKRPTTQQDVSTSVVLYADALDWDPDGEFLIYDAFNALPTAAGDSLAFWDVTLLEPEEEFFVPLLPPQPRGVQFGNPTVARTSGRHVVFDRFDSNTDSNEVWVYDLVTGDAAAIVETGRAIGFPAFSPDDGELIYEKRDGFGRTFVARVPLSEDRLRAAGPEQDFLLNAQIPNWLVIAEEDPATSVGEVESAAPTEHALTAIYPNPFNPATTIAFELATPARVTLTVYDIRGARVARLVEGERGAGAYRVPWDGRDDRGRPVATGVYLARLRALAGDEVRSDTRRMTLIR
jgi:bacillolysin